MAEVRVVRRTTFQAGLVVLLLAAGTALAGCDAIAPDPEPSCIPSGPVEVSPATVAPGGTVTVSSGSADCAVERRYSHYELRLGSTDDAPVLGKVDVGTHGEFRTTVTVPADASPGDEVIAVRGSAYDYCPGHAGPDADCPGYFGRVTVTAG